MQQVQVNKVLLESDHEHVGLGSIDIMDSEAHPHQQSISVQEGGPALVPSTSNHVAVQQPGMLLQSILNFIYLYGFSDISDLPK